MFNVFSLFTSLFSDIQFLCKRLSSLLLMVMLPLLLSALLTSLTASAGEPEPLKSGARFAIDSADAKGSLFVEVLTKASQKISARKLNLDDIPAFLFGLNGKKTIEADEWTLFYNNLQSPDKSVEIVTRELDPNSKIYRTIFRIDLGKIPANVIELSLALATSLPRLKGKLKIPWLKILNSLLRLCAREKIKLLSFHLRLEL